jgi:hypothetical protein
MWHAEKKWRRGYSSSAALALLPLQDLHGGVRGGTCHEKNEWSRVKICVFFATKDCTPEKRSARYDTPFTTSQGFWVCLLLFPCKSPSVMSLVEATVAVAAMAAATAETIKAAAMKTVE